ncbi:MAG: outer membrane lipoprotein carrier protein LolA [Phycisphaerae bacterium]
MIWLVILAMGLNGPDKAAQARIDTVLEQLEARGATVADLKCKVSYTISDTIADDRYTKFGEIRYKKMEPNPRFYIHFAKMHQDDIVSRKQEWYLFDGQDLWEIKEAAKNKIKHKVVGAGESIDLFDIEQSPIPIPFGQKKAQIQRNFAVVLMAPEEGDPPETDHLICQPKVQSRLYGDVVRMEFFVSRSLHLPVKIVTVQRSGTQITTAVFANLTAKSINTGLSTSAFGIPRQAQGWPTVEAKEGSPLPAGD